MADGLAEVAPQNNTSFCRYNFNGTQIYPFVYVLSMVIFCNARVDIVSNKAYNTYYLALLERVG